MIRLISLIFLGLLLGCAEQSEPKPEQLLEVRIPRKHLISDLIKDGVNFYQQGQTITMLVPSDKLFVAGTTNDAFKAALLYKDMVKVLNTYRLGQLDISAHIIDIKNKSSDDFARAKAQAVHKSLLAYGLRAPVIFTQGNSELAKDLTYKMTDFIKIQFRYLRILV